jgi:hypothetical protein
MARGGKGPPCPTLLHPADGPPLMALQPYHGGPLAGSAAVFYPFGRPASCASGVPAAVVAVVPVSLPPRMSQHFPIFFSFGAKASGVGCPRG